MARTHNFNAIVLAAGHGTRMRTTRPKLLHEACGRTLVDWTCDAVEATAPARVVAVCPDADGPVARAFAARGATIAVQAEPRGTGDAVAKGLAALPTDDDGLVLVTNGDLPCLRGATLAALVAAHGEAGNHATLMSGHAHDPTGWGRIERDAEGVFTGVVEEADATDEQRSNSEVNVGPAVCDAARLRAALRTVPPRGEKREIYFPAALAAIRAAGGAIDAVPLADPDEVQQVNTQAELAEAATELRFRLLSDHLDAGVTVVDPSSTYIEAGVAIGAGTVIHPFSVLRRGVKIGADCEVGPFAHLRTGADLRDTAAIGNFVEVKHSVVHPGAKAKHLTYLGDAEVGANANVGAGTITANYDGRRKHKTVIGEGAHIGSNTVLVAPVRVGARAVTGAGAVVLRDVPDGVTVVGVPARALDARVKPGGAA